MDLTIVTCNYNTPDLIINLIKSINIHCKEIPRILVMETGEEVDTSQKIEGIDYFYLPNSSHAVGVQRAFDLVDTNNVLLVDSDVLFLRDFTHPFNVFKYKGLTLMGEVVGDRGGKSLHPRVNPWFCFINLKHLKEHNIKFHDFKRMEADKERIYDIGSTMFEDVTKADLLVGDVKMENVYYKHYEGMSWRIQRYNPHNGDTGIDTGGTHDNFGLYQYGMMVRQQYEKDTENIGR